MSESKSHKVAANRIAKKLNAEYNSDKGVDIVTQRVAIEVETPETISSGFQQLRGHRKPVYIAGTNREAVEKALAATKNTTVGVMDSTGKIIKLSTRKKS
ncbi:hypothetical protein ACFL6H_03560 [Candidatus Latescibacterota bacterium]